jgi:nucleotide-binding universal stress UspA family protein
VILICYDGSADANAAIEHGAELLKGQPATVLTVWQPFVEVLAASGFGLAPGIVNTEEVDDASRKRAEQRADEGAKLARAAGFNVRVRTCSQKTTVAGAILAEAEAVDASAILMGSRGLTGLKSLLLGSVSHAVIQHADRAVIVVPSTEVAASRSPGRRAISGSK